MTDKEMREIAERAATSAVQQVFGKLGVDTTKQGSINELRADLVFTRDLRKTTKGIQNKILMVVVTAAVLGIGAAIFKGFGFPHK